MCVLLGALAAEDHVNLAKIFPGQELSSRCVLAMQPGAGVGGIGPSSTSNPDDAAAADVTDVCTLLGALAEHNHIDVNKGFPGHPLNTRCQATAGSAAHTVHSGK